jgi:hemerythrin superfamily protein
MEILNRVVQANVAPLKQPKEVEAPAAPPAGDAEDLEVPEPVGEHAPADEDTTSVMFIIPNDHDRIKGLYRRYKDPTDTPRQRQLLALQLLREMTVHILAEETVVYPVVADEIEEHMRDHAMDEHESLKLFTSDLQGMKLEDEGYEDKMHQLMETFLEHIHEEEHRMLPALREVLDDAQLREMGKRFLEAKQHLPTRPHPADPKHPGHLDDAVVLLDAARDAAQFEGTPPAIGSPSTEVLMEGTVGGPA